MSHSYIDVITFWHKITLLIHCTKSNTDRLCPNIFLIEGTIYELFGNRIMPLSKCAWLQDSFIKNKILNVIVPSKLFRSDCICILRQDVTLLNAYMVCSEYVSGTNIFNFVWGSMNCSLKEDIVSCTSIARHLVGKQVPAMTVSWQTIRC
jgi:hypothetical protein